jgi:predicted RNase H-like HicB family nuclease
MTRKASVLIEQDEHGFYAWCPELKGCQSQGATIEDALANIREAIELYLGFFLRRHPGDAACRRLLPVPTS